MTAEQLQRVYMRFSREVYILSTLQSPRIVPLYACASTTEDLTLVMQYMRRGSLNRVLCSENAWREVTPEMRHRLLCDVAQGMQYLHDRNVYHRDLKSHNVLLTDDWRAVLTDFGMSKTCSAITAATHAKSTYAGGTLAWTAPEVFKPRVGGGHRSNFTFKSDVYSYGIVVWEVLVADAARAAPQARRWIQQQMGELVAAVLRGDQPPLPADSVSDANVARAASHEALMRRCLAAEPEARPSFREAVAEQAAM
ncbi:kinase-like domain-containing protein [Tribonema minus]|uniref:Kinase-like domain-containing protein n=1 Tax=Tribonema minus TaxID=303371 RepID=A0A835YN29_9STRA|nr:kinase-like domain-containing protein [Tribonema minus]